MAEKTASAGRISRTRWRLRLLAFALVLLAIGFLGCLVLFRYLEIYEITRPEITMERLMETTTREEWLAMAEMNLDYEVTEFEDARELYRSFEDSLSSEGELSCSVNKSLTTEDKAAFTLRAGPAALCSVELVPGPNRYAFGRHDWILGRVGTGDVTKQLSSVTVKLQCLKGDRFFLNGLPISEKYVSKERVEIKDLSPLEKRYEQVPCFTEYTIGPLYGEIKITDEAGTEYSPTEEKSTRAVYDLCPVGSGALTITAPEDVTVTVGGTVLGKKDVSSSTAEPFTNWGETGGGYVTDTYHFEGLFSAPEVTAVDKSGTQLTPIRVGDEFYAFFYPSEKEGLEKPKEIAETYFDYYMHYTFAPFEMTYYFNLLQRTVYDSPLFQYIAKSQATMMWAANTEPEYKTLAYDNYHFINDYCFMCTVEYDVDLTSVTWDSDEMNYNLQSAYELIFIKRGPNWYAAEMIPLGT